jgi:PAS domain S-box-containing protein
VRQECPVRGETAKADPGDRRRHGSSVRHPRCPRGRDRAANQAGLDLLGYSREELLRLRIPDVDADPDAVLPAHGEPLGGGRLVNYQHRVVRKDGRIVTVLDNSRPLTDGSGAVVGMQSTLSDITGLVEAQEERARLQARLHEAQALEAIGRLAGGVAHDFNNMLGVILGCTELALSRLPPGDPIRALLDEARDAALRSAGLTRQLLALASRQAAEPVVLDLNATVAGMLSMLGRVIGENVQLVWTPGAGVWPVRMDPSQLDQILAHLCVNARDAIADVGSVRIATANATLSAAQVAGQPGAEPGDYAVLTFANDGCGMAPEVLAHVFEPFFTTKGTGHPAGLGLATVYGIVRQSHGVIEVRSAAGRGTTFTIWLPARRGAVPAPAMPPCPIAAPPAATVLLVEDEPSVRRVTGRMLERFGCVVLGAGSAAAALLLAEAHAGRIDLLLTDLVMPDQNGRVLAAQLRARYPALRTLLMSGYANDALPPGCVLGPDEHFLAKPFTGDELAHKVRQVLAAPV